MKRIVLLFIVVIISVYVVTGVVGNNSSESLPNLTVPNFAAILFDQTNYTLSTALPTLNTDFQEALAKGMNGEFYVVGWKDMEPTPLTYDFSTLRSVAYICKALNLTLYINVKTIDTNNLAIPSDLQNSTSHQLANGITWMDQNLINRWFWFLGNMTANLNVFYPKSQQFFLGVGNEVDVWLNSQSDPNQVSSYLSFVTASSSFIKTLTNPLCAVAVSTTLTGSLQNPKLFSRIIAVEDVISMTWYPLNSDFTVSSLPKCIAEWQMFMNLTFVNNKSIIMQEIGFPSGYNIAANNAASYDNSSQQKQTDFVTWIFTVLNTNKARVRGWAWIGLNDFTKEECDQLSLYYGVSAPAFIEYLCTLGLVNSDGSYKQAYPIFLNLLDQYFHPSSSPTPSSAGTAYNSLSPSPTLYGTTPPATGSAKTLCAWTNWIV